MIKREITGIISYLAQKYPLVAVVGPRQSGKSTLLIDSFPDYEYVNLEQLDIRQFAIDDPKSFLEKYPRAIFDEVQYVPDLFSYLQVETDKKRENGQYILSGSQNFLLMENISQSLAGRVGIVNLLPFSFNELKNARRGYANIPTERLIFTGGYPRIYDRDIDPAIFYDDYIRTYIDRDVNELLNVRDILAFNRFLKLCALRIGQVLNVANLAADADIKVDTANSWLSILESSFIIHFLTPYYVNVGKRLIKSPKLYFYDTGLASYLLNIRRVEDMKENLNYGNLFENLIINEKIKGYLNKKMSPELSFWRDSNRIEVDLLDRTEGRLQLVEIKSSRTAKSEWTDNLLAVEGVLKGVGERSCQVVFDGESEGSLGGVKYRNWRNWLAGK